MKLQYWNKVGKNEYIVSYKDLLCHATFDWDTFEYYAFDQGGNWMSDLQIKIWNALIELDGETVAELFTNFYGNQLLDQDFSEFLEQEGIL